MRHLLRNESGLCGAGVGQLVKRDLGKVCSQNRCSNSGFALGPTRPFAKFALSAGESEEDRRLDQVLNLIDRAAEKAFKILLPKNVPTPLKRKSHQFIKHLQKVLSGNAATLQFFAQVQSCFLKFAMKARNLFNFLPIAFVAELDTEQRLEFSLTNLQILLLGWIKSFGMGSVDLFNSVSTVVRSYL